MLPGRTPGLDAYLGWAAGDVSINAVARPFCSDPFCDFGYETNHGENKNKNPGICVKGSSSGRSAEEEKNPESL